VILGLSLRRLGRIHDGIYLSVPTTHWVCPTSENIPTTVRILVQGSLRGNLKGLHCRIMRTNLHTLILGGVIGA
jgi:hypothetical protein